MPRIQLVSEPEGACKKLACVSAGYEIIYPRIVLESLIFMSSGGLEQGL